MSLRLGRPITGRALALSARLRARMTGEHSVEDGHAAESSTHVAGVANRLDIEDVGVVAVLPAVGDTVAIDAGVLAGRQVWEPSIAHGARYGADGPVSTLR